MKILFVVDCTVLNHHLMIYCNNSCPLAFVCVNCIPICSNCCLFLLFVAIQYILDPACLMKLIVVHNFICVLSVIFLTACVLTDFSCCLSCIPCALIIMAPYLLVLIHFRNNLCAHCPR